MIPETYLHNVFCDKCGKETVVETVSLPEVKKPPKQSMADYDAFGIGIGLTLPVYLTTHYHLECKSCGNVREFSR